MLVIFICINVRSPVFRILTSTDNKVKQLQKHSPVYNTCVKSNQLVLVIEVFSRKTHLFILLQGSGNLLLFLILFEMLEPFTKLFQLCIFIFKITLQSVDSSLFSFAMWAALSLPFLAWRLEIFTFTPSFAHKSTPTSFFTRPFENSWNSTFLQNNFLAFSIFANFVIFLAEVSWANACVLCNSKIISLVAANFSNPLVV